ncbi:glycoside hydrolase family 3 N-terminal domain-containing protein [Demequina salsinemoris]|uniref:glycoside hydrolase family 3 N-terminal domain-containing protein n=1 Tax=Demequina salsinemoris TaxID=577470 RepID=UPI0007822287|nr:glycoside hydrolase family 3 N-terminal domain-containing protein [Demequina salsinemoris]
MTKAVPAALRAGVAGLALLGLVACTGTTAEVTASTPASAASSPSASSSSAPSSSAPADPTTASSPSATGSAEAAHAEATAEPETLVWGPTVDAWEQALDDAAELGLWEAAGAVIMPAYSGTDPEELADLVADASLAGVMLMGDATRSRKTVLALTEAAQAGAGDRGWQALVSVDQEGGSVARLDGIVPSLQSFMAAGAATDKSLVRGVYARAGADLAELGFAVDLAPVADVTIGLDDPVIRDRSAGDDPSAVAGTVVAAMLGYLDGGVVPALKHFPGHGAATTDSHDDVPVLSGSLDDLEATGIAPFRRAIAVGAPMVMMSHVAVDAWGGIPASLDPEAYAYLREELGFTGVAVTDALNMGAIIGSHDAGEAAVDALAAGADLLLMPESTKAARRAIVSAVKEGSLSRERLNEAAARVILLSRWQESLTTVEATVDGDYAEALALGSVTVGAADCSAPFVGDTVTISGGFEADREALAAAFEDEGVSVGDDGTSVWITGGDGASGEADVVVAMGGPWALARSQARVYVGAYGRSADTLAAVASVLAGAADPQGSWPVALKGVPDAC